MHIVRAFARRPEMLNRRLKGMLATDANGPLVRQGRLGASATLRVWIGRDGAHDKTSVPDDLGPERVAAPKMYSK